MNCRTIACCILLAVASTQRSNADDAPIARLEIKPESVLVGQPVQFRLTVLGPTWFPTPPVYPAFEQVNLATRLPPNSSFPTSERIDGENWSGIVRDYQLFPQAAGEYAIGGQSIRVTWADPETREPRHTDVPVPVAQLTAMVPEGAETLDPYLGSPRVTLEQTVEGETEALMAGDALVRTVTATAADLPSMFLPPILYSPPQDGISVYPKNAVLDEQSDNRSGALTSRRIETATYVFDRGGTYILPALELQWWNTDTRSIESATVPAVSVSVSGAAVASEAEQQNPTAIDWMTWVLVLATLTVLLLASRWVLPWAGRRVAAWREAWLTSERRAYGRVMNAFTRGDLHEAMQAVARWAACAQSKYGTTLSIDDVDGLSELSRQLYGRNGTGGTLARDDRIAVVRAVRVLRRELLRGRGSASRIALPELNP